ncbi:MAG: metal ABC transporter substrate-binding protein [Thermodesulfovibrionales bacterium]
MVNVDFMVPTGASPHTFEPTPSDMLKMQKARMFVIIGAGLEFWAEKAVKATGRRDLKVVILSEGMPLIYGEHSHGENRNVADPHIWLDPLLTVHIADKIKNALIELDRAHESYYRERAEGFKKELYKLHQRIIESVKHFRTKEYVAFHPAWNYFSRRYGLRTLGVIEESPGKEASPRHIAKIIMEIRRTRAKAVFAEPQFNPKIAEVIAKEAGARVLFLDPLGSPDIKGRDTYIGLMRYNLSMLEDAMR